MGPGRVKGKRAAGPTAMEEQTVNEQQQITTYWATLTDSLLYKLRHANAALDLMTTQRDQARALAVELEKEIHACNEGHWFHQKYAYRGD